MNFSLILWYTSAGCTKLSIECHQFLIKFVVVIFKVVDEIGLFLQQIVGLRISCSNTNLIIIAIDFNCSSHQLTFEFNCMNQSTPYKLTELRLSLSPRYASGGKVALLKCATLVMYQL